VLSVVAQIPVLKDLYMERYRPFFNKHFTNLQRGWTLKSRFLSGASSELEDAKATH
jgi:hypothetical protein